MDIKVCSNIEPISDEVGGERLRFVCEALTLESHASVAYWHVRHVESITSLKDVSTAIIVGSGPLVGVVRVITTAVGTSL